MRYLLIASAIALIAIAVPLSTYSRAEDAHHPEKAAKAKQSKASKAAPKKKTPAAKSEKAKQSELVPGTWPVRG